MLDLNCITNEVKIDTAVVKFLEPPERERPQEKKTKDKFKIVSLSVQPGVDFTPELVSMGFMKSSNLASPAFFVASQPESIKGISESCLGLLLNFSNLMKPLGPIPLVSLGRYIT